MIRIIVTGGTFDKEYNELNGTLFFKDTHVLEMLRLGRSRVEVTVETLMMMDSLDMTDADRARIVEACRVAPESRVVRAIHSGHAPMPKLFKNLVFRKHREAPLPRGRARRRSSSRPSSR